MRAPGPEARGGARQRGLVLIALLLMLILVSVGALSAAEVWATTLKREREEQLLWVGTQYRKAIESYWRSSPSGRRVLPSTVSQLLEDDRFPNPVHHLRQAYRDPMDESQDFELIIVNNALVGVHSTSTAVPMKTARFPRGYEQFADAQDYTQWRFVFLPPILPGAAAARAPVNPGALPGMPTRR